MAGPGYDQFSVRSFGCLALVACAAPVATSLVVVGAGLPRAGRAPEWERGSIDEPIALPADASRLFTIWLGGERVGTAVETEAWTHDGVRLRREETMRFLRGAAEVELVTTIDIDADARAGRTPRAVDRTHGPRRPLARCDTRSRWLASRRSERDGSAEWTRSPQSSCR